MEPSPQSGNPAGLLCALSVVPCLARREQRQRRLIILSPCFICISRAARLESSQSQRARASRLSLLMREPVSSSDRHAQTAQRWHRLTSHSTDWPPSRRRRRASVHTRRVRYRCAGTKSQQDVPAQAGQASARHRGRGEGAARERPGQRYAPAPGEYGEMRRHVPRTLHTSLLGGCVCAVWRL